MRALKKVVDKNKDGYVSEKEVDEAVKILERARQQKQQIALELFHQNKI
jgi:Ca2+-binding EF-hand superfamily protein